MNYIIEMADMGFGLSRQDVMCLAFQLAEKSGMSHPFKDNSAGRRWFNEFYGWHLNLTLPSAQSLSFLRAKKQLILRLLRILLASLNLCMCG